jgi:hypothetical protein
MFMHKKLIGAQINMTRRVPDYHIPFVKLPKIQGKERILKICKRKEPSQNEGQPHYISSRFFF